MLSGKLMPGGFFRCRRHYPWASHSGDFGLRYESQGTKDLSVIMKKALPKFKSQAAEREFWATHHSADFIDWRKG
jgi:hypothetical protein